MLPVEALPMNPWDLTPTDIAQRLRQLGFRVFDQPGDPTVVSIRARDRRAGPWRDAHAVLWHDDHGQLLGTVGRGTTVAGREYLTGELPGNPRGTAVALPGQYRGCWKVGPDALHNRSKGKPYPAWEQVGPIEYLRDTDRDDIIDVGTTGYAETPEHFATLRTAIVLGQQVHTDIIKLNMHRGPSTPTEKVGPWSAACQVWLDRSAYAEALAVCIRAIPRYGNKVSWALLDQWWALR